MMRVNLYATLRTAAGGKVVEVAVPPPATVHAVLKAVSDLRPPLARQLWDADGQLKEHIKVFVNGRQIAFLPNGIETLLDDDDEVDVFPPVGGGTEAHADGWAMIRLS